MPFLGSYYQNNFLGGSNDAFISKIYYGDCLISNVSSPLNKSSQLEILPNPAVDIISITLPREVQDHATILLFDAPGKTLKQYYQRVDNSVDATFSLDIKSFPTGLYHVVIQTPTHTYRGKFVKM